MFITTIRAASYFTLLLTTCSLASAAVIERRAARTSPPAGALVVRQTGTQAGEYASISEAVTALGTGRDSKTIFIYSGTYKEQVWITYKGASRHISMIHKNNALNSAPTQALSIVGYTKDTSSYEANEVTITSGVDAKAAGGNDESATLRVHRDNFSLYNVNVANSFGKGSQAVALSTYGSKQGYYGVKITGYQDTLLTNFGTNLFAKSYVSGSIDFIFGMVSVAWFDGVTIAATDIGAITASGRDTATNPSLWVFNKCTVTAPSAAAGWVYLGRPWRNFARVIFQHTDLGNAIHPAGWVEWNVGDARTDQVLLAEFENSGDVSKRAAFSTQLKKAYTISSVLGDTYADWVDSAYLS